jgi:hypothetical protein
MAKIQVTDNQTSEAMELEVTLELDDGSPFLAFGLQSEGGDGDLAEYIVVDHEEMDLFFEEMDLLKAKWMAREESGL